MKKILQFFGIIIFGTLPAVAAFQTLNETPLSIILGNSGLARPQMDTFLMLNPAGLAQEEKYIFAGYQKYLYSGGASEYVPGYISPDISRQYLVSGGWPVFPKKSWRMSLGVWQMRSPAYSEMAYLFGAGSVVSQPLEKTQVRVGGVLKIFQLKYSSDDYTQNYFTRYGQSKSALSGDLGLQYQSRQNIFAVAFRNLLPADIGLLDEAIVPGEIALGWWHDFSFCNVSADLIYRENSSARAGFGLEVPMTSFLKIAAGATPEKVGFGLTFVTCRYLLTLALVDLYQMENSGNISVGLKWLW